MINIKTISNSAKKHILNKGSLLHKLVNNFNKLAGHSC